ncbi:MAG: prepilin-type N-terminal cleavage/methylation domain-containing protein [Candidatus Pacebacteria bacterium]|nr:prepilin-type N-terminal cleavage/methylation domain-containing protein [Candidatus Paceibacterota bacterium]
MKKNTLHIASFQKGFTLIESLVSIFIFVLLALAVYQTSAAVIRETRTFRETTTISGLADQYMEVVRNMPYSQIGTINGNPHGNLYDQPNATTTVVNGTAYQIYYVVNYIDDPADGTILAGTDPAPNDYKQVKLYVKNTVTGVTTSFFSNFVPKGLENINNAGAFSIKVFDAVGQPISGASISIRNATITPAINLSRISDASGNWIEVGLPDAANSYHVVVTKNGYSTDQTYPVSGSNPNPIKADSTIANGQVTQVSFSIDQLSNLVINTVDQTCSALSGVGLRVQGSKLIGTPNVLKFDKTYTSDGNGQVSLSNLEWDNYTPSLISTSTYMVYGSSPIQQINILPNTNQTFALLLGPETANSLLVIVKDASTGNAIEGANVDLQTLSPQTDTNKLTGGSNWSQQSWTGGSGQENFVDPTMYSQDDGNISTNDIPTGMRLISNNGQAVVNSGSLISSSFDTGATTTTYTNLNWQPTSQDPAATVKFQIATNNDNATWNFVGPDGTASTYYTVPGTSISPSSNNNRYIRYKAFLSTTDLAKNPVVTSVGINYVAGCFTPGQVFFPGLTAGSNYQLVVSMPGYQTKTISDLNISGYNILQVSLSQ